MSLDNLHNIILNTYRLVDNNEKKPPPTLFPCVAHKFIYEVDLSHTDRLLQIFNSIHSKETALAQPIATIANADMSSPSILSKSSIRASGKRDRLIGSSLIFSCLNLILHQGCYIEAFKYISRAFFVPYVCNCGDLASVLIQYLLDRSMLSVDSAKSHLRGGNPDDQFDTPCTFKIVTSPKGLANYIVGAMTAGEHELLVSSEVFRPGEGNSTHQIHCVYSSIDGYFRWGVTSTAEAERQSLTATSMWNRIVEERHKISNGETEVPRTEAVCRAYYKIQEVIEYHFVQWGWNREYLPFEIVVDVGASPGGWTQYLARISKKVIAVDPGELRPEVLALKNVQYLPNLIENENIQSTLRNLDGKLTCCICDINVDVEETANLLLHHVLPHMSDGVIVMTLKLCRSPTMNRIESAVKSVKAILNESGKCFDYKVIHCNSNSANERTIVCKYRNENITHIKDNEYQVVADDDSIRQFVDTFLDIENLNESSEPVEFKVVHNAVRERFYPSLKNTSKKTKSIITECIRNFRRKVADIRRKKDDKKCEEEFIVCSAYSRNYTIGDLCSYVNEKYCNKHGYKWYCEKHLSHEEMMQIINPRSNCSWYKILMLKKMMYSLLYGDADRTFIDGQEISTKTENIDSCNGKLQYLMWIDADAMIVDSDVSLSSIINKGDYMDLIISEDMNETSYINAGIFLLKVNTWSYQLLVDCYENTEKYFTVAQFDQAALEKQLKIRFQGLDRHEGPFHSFAKGGKHESKFFTNVCVLTSRDFNTNIEDEETLANEDGHEEECTYTDSDAVNKDYSSNDSEKYSGREMNISFNKQKIQIRGGSRKLSRNNDLRRKAKQMDGESYNGYAKFVFHVAGRRKKVQLLLQMMQSRHIRVPQHINYDCLFKFKGRPFTPKLQQKNSSASTPRSTITT